MPNQAFPLPLSMDDRDAFSIAANSAASLLGLRSERERLTRLGGSTAYGTGSVGSFARNIVQGFQGSASLVEDLLLLTATSAFKYTDSTNAWTQVNAAVGEPEFPGAIILNCGAVERYSWVYTLNSIFFSDGNEAEIYNFNSDVVSRFSTLGHVPSGINKMGAYVLLPFADRVVAVRTLEDTGGGPVDKKTRVRWHVLGDITDWNGDGAGFLDVVETSSQPIIGAAVLGERAYIFKERQIIELIQTGSVDEVFRTETRVHGTGMVCRHSWAATEQFGFFVGPDDVYMWDGSNVQAIGTPIRQTLFNQIDFQSVANFIGPSKVQGVIYAPRQEYWLLVQAAATVNLFIYDYRRNRWYTDFYNESGIQPFCIGDVNIGESILNHPGNIDQTSFLLLGRNSQVPVFLSEGLATRNGSAFTSEVITRDFPAMKLESQQILAAMDRMNTLWELTFRLVPNSQCQVAYSTDGGTTYSAFTTVTANADGIVRWFVGPIVFQRIRFRVRSLSGQSFELSQQMSFRWMQAGINYGAIPSV